MGHCETFLLYVRTTEDKLWIESGDPMMAVSREEMEDDRVGVGGGGDGDGMSSLLHRICKTAFSEGNSAMSIRLQTAWPKSESSYCIQNSPTSSSF